ADLDTFVQINWKLGNEELRLGHTEAAIAACALVRDAVRGSQRKDLIATAYYELGVASMRLGETQNCVCRHGSDSCVFPIHGNGLHAVKEGSAAAMDAFEQ